MRMRHQDRQRDNRVAADAAAGTVAAVLGRAQARAAARMRPRACAAMRLPVLAAVVGLAGLTGLPGRVGALEPVEPAEPAEPTTRLHGHVWHDRDGDGRRDPGEAGVAGVGVSNGRELAHTDARGDYVLPVRAGDTVFAIKPPGWRLPGNDPARPRFWHQVPPHTASSRPDGALKPAPAPARFDLGLQRAAERPDGLDVLVFADPQVKSTADVGHYGRDIVDSVLDARRRGEAGHDALGLSLGDIVDDVLPLYPALDAQTRRLQTPWLHAPGNHDIDVDAAHDADSLATFRTHYGPDSYAWEEPEASFVVLDDVIYRPGERPAYIGGFREEQFAFLEAYLRTLRRDRLLVLAIHIPLWEPDGRDTFRDADRERLFALLRDVPQVLVLSGHAHAQRHVRHGIASGWHGAQPLHEFVTGAACGAFWTGVPDARGVPDATMDDGTPNGYARLHVPADGGAYRLAWRVAGLAPDAPAHASAQTHAMHLHAPASLRRGAYPAFGVYANVYMGEADSPVDYRIDDGEWRPMTRVVRPDPRLLAENVADDRAAVPRGYDRSPEAAPSPHLWRGTLPTDLPAGEHRIEVRMFDRWQGEQRAATAYRLVEVPAPAPEAGAAP